MKQEADFSIRLRHYLKAHPLPVSCPLEVKDTRGKPSFYYAELKEEQCNNALASKSDKGNLIRISVGTVGSPDYAYYRNSPAYVVVKYPLGFTFIDIETLLIEKLCSNRKSLTWERAQAISIRTVKTK
jgi:hypothetical protein